MIIPFYLHILPYLYKYIFRYSYTNIFAGHLGHGRVKSPKLSFWPTARPYFPTFLLALLPSFLLFLFPRASYLSCFVARVAALPTLGASNDGFGSSKRQADSPNC